MGHHQHLLWFLCAFFAAAPMHCSDNHLTLDEKYSMSWELIGDSILFHLIVETTGFVGFGISPNGDMNGADIVIGGFNASSGQPYLQDRHGVGNVDPVLDDSQDYKLIAASSNGTHTSLAFSRLLNTCDPQDFLISWDTHKLIWAFGESDKLAYHGTGSRGVSSQNLMDPVIAKADLSRFKVWQMMSDLPLPNEYTTYWCTIHQTPESMNPKQHIVGFDAVLLSPAAPHHTHHIDIYQCELPPGGSAQEIFDPYLQDRHSGVDCYNKPTGSKFPNKHCTHLQYGWAKGGKETMFPEHTGFPVAGNTYYMMEVHYDNPAKLLNLSMTTGLEVYYTGQLRPIEAAYLMVASKTKFTQMIPPNSVAFTQVAHCGTTCTQNFPPGGIRIFSVILHAHLSGRAIKVRQFRNGVELPWPSYDANYDFDYQQSRRLRREIVVQPGDHLTVECLYDTTWKPNLTTIGGRSTREEMCEANLFYYPLMENVIECLSEVPVQTLLDFLGIENVTLNVELGEEDPTITNPVQHNGTKYSKHIEQLDWDAVRRSKYQKLHRFSEHDGECFPQLGRTSYKTGYPYTETEYAPVEQCPKPGLLSAAAVGKGSTLILFAICFHLAYSL